MKRTPDPVSPGSNRFEKLPRSSPQLQLQQQQQQQYHQQHLHHQQQQQQLQQQQQQRNMAMAAAMSNRQYYAGVGATRSPGMVPYGRAPMPTTQSSYMYNTGLVGNGLPTRMWNFNVSVPPPPLPLAPPPRQQRHPFPPPLPSMPDGEHTCQNTNTARKLTTPSASLSWAEDAQPFINKKPKRKSMSSRYGSLKEWVREDAIKAIALEDAYSKPISKVPILLLRFPDPDVNREIISQYSPNIESVHFQQNSAARFCFVHLKEDADINKTIETISKIPFGTGYVSAELRRLPPSEPITINPDEVDPYTLYIGNLPTSICSRTVKEHFPGAHRIDIGFAQRIKYTRYAFVRYSNVEDAMNGFKRSVNTLMDSRSLIVRFRRQRSIIASGELATRNNIQAVHEPADSKQCEKEDMPATNANNSSDVPSGSQTQTASVQRTPSAAVPAEHNFSTAFDSPSSIEEPENIHADSKEHVFEKAQQLRKKLNRDQQASNGAAARRSSLDEMFVELERRDSRLADINISNPSATLPPIGVRIKEENSLDDDETLSEDDDGPFANLLGARYNESDAQVKQEQSEEELTANQNQREDIYCEDFEYDEEFDNEPEEYEDANWRGAQLLNGDHKPSNLELLRQQELSSSEKKPTSSQLQSPSAGAAKSVNEHSSFMKKLYDQVRRAKKTENRKRPRDELDDMFAQMNSDTDDDQDLF